MNQPPIRFEDVHSAIISANPEADVILVLISDAGDIKTCPMWECEATSHDLQIDLVAAALYFNEELGEGTVRGHIIDLRALRAIAAAEAEPVQLSDILDETPIAYSA